MPPLFIGPSLAYCAGEGSHDEQDVGGVHLGLHSGQMALPGGVLPPGEGSATVRERAVGGRELPG